MNRFLLTSLILVSVPVYSSFFFEEWKFEESEEKFSSEKIYDAKVVKFFGGEYTPSYGYVFGIQCRKDKYLGDKHLITFSFYDQPIAYYNSDIKILVEVNDKKYIYSGKTYSNSMESGYAYLKNNAETLDLIKDLETSSSVDFLVRPEGVGEDNGRTMPLKGSSKALKKLFNLCPIQ